MEKAGISYGLPLPTIHPHHTPHTNTHSLSLLALCLLVARRDQPGPVLMGQEQ